MKFPLRTKTVVQSAGIVALSLTLAACNSTSSKKEKEEVAHINTETKFSAKDYGVKGSPRVTTKKRVKKGGGRYQVGKPYKIKGRWYHPKEDPDYKKVGMASWYGPNFHGRLTANGEIYDQYSLSAAHPTMPLPSYAKVTNLENGSSVTVRVNDRGPFASNRIIDLSAKAAEYLDFTKQGLAKVKVEYIGKARMDGQDEQMLLASYVPPKGREGDVPGTTLGGTLIASAEPSTQEKPEAITVASNIPEGSSVSTAYSTSASSRGAAGALNRADGGELPVDLLAAPRVVQASSAASTTVVGPAPTSGLQPVGYMSEPDINSRISSAFAAIGEPAGLTGKAFESLKGPADFGYRVELGEFRSTSNAERLETEISRALGDQAIVMIRPTERDTLAVTAFADNGSVSNILQRAAELGIKDARILANQ